MYIISKLTGKIYLNGVEIPLDDSKPEFQQYLLDKDVVGVEYVEATPEEISEQQAIERKAKETELYKKRTLDGINAYAEISAEFRLAKISGTITEEAHAHI